MDQKFFVDNIYFKHKLYAVKQKCTIYGNVHISINIYAKQTTSMRVL